MSKCSTRKTTSCANIPARPSDSDFRVRRLQQERSVLALRLEAVLAGRPEIMHVRFQGLTHLSAYASLEPEGLVHATVGYDRGCVIVLAVASRVLKVPMLRRRLFSLRRNVQAHGRRIVIVTARGLLNRLRRDRPCNGR